MNLLSEILRGADRRSIGRMPEVLKLLALDISSLPQLIQALEDADPVVRMRSADALEKLAADHLSAIIPHKEKLIDIAKATMQ